MGASISSMLSSDESEPPTVPDVLCRPRRRMPSTADVKKIRKLIKSHKLAPYHPAMEIDIDTGSIEFDECPICFLSYSSLNRTVCCKKLVCTECFVQVQCTAKPPGKANCPFCKANPLSVRYSGARSREEREIEWREEQRAADAQSRQRSGKPHPQEQEQQPQNQEPAGQPSRRRSLASGQGSSGLIGAAVAASTARGECAGCPAGPVACAPEVPSAWQHCAPRQHERQAQGDRDLLAARFVPTLLLELHADSLEDLNEAMLNHAICSSLQHRWQQPADAGPDGGGEMSVMGAVQQQQQLRDGLELTPALPVQVPA